MGLFNLVHDGFEPFFELAPEFGAGDQSAHVQSQHAAALEGVGYVSSHDTGGQALDDGSLAHAGLADDHGVILLPPGQRLHNLANLFASAHNRVQFTLTGQLGQVDAVFVQGTVAALGPWVVHAVAAPDIDQRLINLFLVDAVFFQYLGRISLGLHDGGDEQVLGADVVILQPVRFILGVFQEPGGSRSWIDLGGVVSHFGSGLQCAVQLGGDSVYRHPDLDHDLSGCAVLQL